MAEGEYKDVVVVVLVLVVVSISLFKLLTDEKGDYQTCAVQNASPCQASSRASRGRGREKVQNGGCTLGQYYSKPTVLLPIIHVIPELISAIQL